MESLPEKRRFYKIFGGGYFVWFLTLPIVTIIAAILSPWVREKIVTTILLVIQTLGFVGLMFLLWPSRAIDYFSIRASNIIHDDEYGPEPGLDDSSPHPL